MLKGLDLVAKIKYEMKHNLNVSNQSVQVPIRDLDLLIELAESNQYRLDLEILKDIMSSKKNQERAMYYEDALRRIDNHIRSTSQPIQYIVEELKAALPEYEEYD